MIIGPEHTVSENDELHDRLIIDLKLHKPISENTLMYIFHILTSLINLASPQNTLWYTITSRKDNDE